MRLSPSLFSYQPPPTKYDIARRRKHKHMDKCKTRIGSRSPSKQTCDDDSSICSDDFELESVDSHRVNIITRHVQTKSSFHDSNDACSTSGDKPECSICIHDLKKDKETLCTSANPKCPHVFHKECIVEWIMEGSDDCPVCRRDFLFAAGGA